MKSEHVRICLLERQGLAFFSWTFGRRIVCREEGTFVKVLRSWLLHFVICRFPESFFPVDFHRYLCGRLHPSRPVAQTVVVFFFPIVGWAVRRVSYLLLACLCSAPRRGMAETRVDLVRTKLKETKCTNCTKGDRGSTASRDFKLLYAEV